MWIKAHVDDAGLSGVGLRGKEGLIEFVFGSRNEAAPTADALGEFLNTPTEEYRYTVHCECGVRCHSPHC